MIFIKYLTAIFQIHFLKGDINKDMFIDNPRIIQLNIFLKLTILLQVMKWKRTYELYEEKEETQNVH